MGQQADSVGARIAQARRELAVRLQRDVSKAELARLLHIGASSVGDWEDNVSKPKGENLVRLADVLGVSAEWIMKGAATLPTRGQSAAARRKEG